MIKKVFLFIFTLIVICLIFVLGINSYVIKSTKDRILYIDKPQDNIDCILVLGAGIWGDEPSPMLKDRLEEGIRLYKEGVTSKIIMSGDHGSEEYDEVNVMKQYAIDAGVPSEDVFMDHAGFSTYESIYRAKEIFDADNIIIVTQEYHLYRALYIADKLGINAYGVNSDPRKYSGQVFRKFSSCIS